MIVKLLTEHHLEFLSLKGASEARPSLHLSKCQIVGNLNQRLIGELTLKMSRTYAESMTGYFSFALFMISLGIILTHWKKKY